MWFCIGLPNFIKIGLSVVELWRHSGSQDGGRQPCWVWFRAMIAHPRSASGGLCFILKFRLDRIYSFGDSAIFIFWHFGLKLPIHAHFQGVLGAYFPQMTLSIVVTPKRHFLARKHVVWERFDLGAGSRKKGQVRTGEDSQKSHKGVIFHLFGEKPPLNRFSQKFDYSCRQRRNHVCKLSSWNFHWLRFYRGSNFTFSYWFFHGPYNSAALLRCLWWRHQPRILSYRKRSETVGR